ncbi:uncharacterized protein N7458_002647 [Penicillium daleae]|uniref:Aminoglycoside phosphotransferase domain-containing protein n=1 Tax=Penicillium daleae TaxID=63821 RepID=A0AAD6G6Y9_9EURO|nr:uncharacterized protein N7458_002647 [Penicillium daleae]KAJ5461095.1 hypothetical protein N7458_002647 [Penicillium daleae]
MVSGMYFWGNHFDYDIARGPFRSSYDWLSSYIDIIVKDQTAAKEEAEDEEDEEDAAFALALAQRLIDLLPKIFPPLQHPPERSQGNITAVIDWECVSAMPVWMTTRMPKFLEGSDREEEPKRQEYADESAKGSDVPGDSEDDELDNEGKDGLYWIHVMEYEQTQLRRLYHASMSQLRPCWDAEVEDTALKQDFAGAVFRCGQCFSLKRIAQWVDVVERGGIP